MIRSLVFLLALVVGLPCLGQGIIPKYGPAVTDWKPIPDPGGIRPFREPVKYLDVWIDPVLYTKYDLAGNSIGSGIEEFSNCIGRVSSLCFNKVPYNQAYRRFHYGTPRQIWDLSEGWRQYGVAGKGSTYFAISPDKRDIWIGVLQKDHITPLTPDNRIRVPGHAWFTSHGWPEQGYKKDVERGLAHCYGYRNPWMSKPIRFPIHPGGIDNPGVAGFDRMEIGWLQTWSSWYGRSDMWVWKQDY